MPKDDVLTLKLPGDNLVFTRYLYIKDEVKTALLVSILNKSDDAIFWAYELYYSGYKNELYAFIWKIYYDFFATLNPSFAAYLAKKLSIKEDLNDRLISSIIQNLLIRSFNTDVFLLRTISELFESDTKSDSDVSIECMLELKDYRELASHILNQQKQEHSLENVYQTVLNYFKLTNQAKLVKENGNVKKEVILLANILSLITFDKEQNLIKKKNFYVRVDPEEVVQYETIESSDKLKPYCILRQSCTRKIAGHSFLNLFQSFRNQPSSLKKKYNEWTDRAVSEKYSSLNKWLYHAAFSPVWFNRIKSCKGYVDYQNQEVKFLSEDGEEDFHSKYNLEPDEQPLFVKENALNLTKENNTSSWQQFFARYKRDGLIDAYEEELDALNDEPLKY